MLVVEDLSRRYGTRPAVGRMAVRGVVQDGRAFDVAEAEARLVRSPEADEVIDRRPHDAVPAAGWPVKTPSLLA